MLCKRSHWQCLNTKRSWIITRKMRCSFITNNRLSYCTVTGGYRTQSESVTESEVKCWSSSFYRYCKMKVLIRIQLMTFVLLIHSAACSNRSNSTVTPWLQGACISWHLHLLWSLAYCLTTFLSQLSQNPSSLPSSVDTNLLLPPWWWCNDNTPVSNARVKLRSVCCPQRFPLYQLEPGDLAMGLQRGHTECCTRAAVLYSLIRSG